MPDREKVITGLELCTNISQDGCLMLCPYKDEKDETYSGFCEQVLKQDALALLKEDCHNCKLECLLQRYDQLKEKYDKLLKEQDAVRPRVSSVEQRCGNCNKVIEMDGWTACPWCGKRIDWEGR